jgi:two-component system, cell cycle sensor histidine kinase and response regulator CckA
MEVCLEKKVTASTPNDLLIQPEVVANENPDKTILLVDDNRILLAAVAEVLRIRGYAVLEHTNAHEAVDCFRQNAEINCVLTDIDMPDLDGVSLVAELRRMRPGVNGIFMTGGRYRPGPAEEVLQKPFTCAELLEALENVGMALTSEDDTDACVA